MSNNAVIYQDRHISATAEKPLDSTVSITSNGGAAPLAGDSEVEIISLRAKAARSEYAQKYPVSDPEQPLGERIRQDERTLAAAIRERSTRQYLTS